MGRMPDRVSLRTSQGGDTPTATPVSTRPVKRGHSPGASPTTEPTAATGVDHHLADLVGLGDGPDLEHPGDDHVAQPLADPLQGVDDQAQVVEGLGQLDGVDLDGCEVA